MKKLLSFSLVASLLVTLSFNSFAYAVKQPPKDEKINKRIDISAYKLYEDFSDVEVGERPSTIATYTVLENTSINVVEGVNEEGKVKNLLVIDDKSTTGNPAFQIPVNQTSNKVLVEAKFKYVKTNDTVMSFTFDLFNGSTTVGRVIQFTNGRSLAVYSNAGVNASITPGLPESDAWYTLQILFDKENALFNVQLQSDSMINKKGIAARYDPSRGVAMLKGTPVYTGTEGKSLTSINVRTTSNVGELYFDWIRVREDVNELEYKGIIPPPLKLPMTTAPVISALDNTINVKINGEYLYFTYPVFEEDGEVYIPLLNIPSAYGLKAKVSQDICSLENEETKINVNLVSGDIDINGKKLNKKMLVKDKVHYIPVIAFAKAMGNDVTYDNEVIITGKE